LVELFAKPIAMHLKLFGFHLLSTSALRESEARAEERWRALFERRLAEELSKVERLQREAEAIRASAERRSREMIAECNRSIREQTEAFDRDWRRREDKTQERVRELEDEFERLSHSLSAYTDKGRKLLALAIDRRTPQHESVAAFLKAREQGISLHRG
jgi:hypothetical protein